MAKKAVVQGRIHRLVHDKGFGFLSVDGAQNDSDVFFHRSALTDTTFDTLMVGQRVTFVVEVGPKGARAADVRVDN